MCSYLVLSTYYSLGEIIMFDIHCPHCAEPYDNDCLHEAAEHGAPSLSYSQAAKLFAAYGCGLFRDKPSKCTNEPIESPSRMAEIQAAMILSDSPDDWLI